MLIGMIDKGYEQIHITYENNKVLFIKVNDTVNLMNKEESLDLLNDLFSTNNFKYIEKENDYDVYLDLANNKRYFKNNIEDFKMFFENNGQAATLCSESDNKKANLSRIFAFILTGTLIPVMFTRDSVDTYLIKIQHEYGVKIQFEDDTLFGNISFEDIPKYEILTNAEQIKEYIYSSEELQDFDKRTLYNEDYFNFVLSIIDTQSKIYDLPKRLDGINIKYYNNNEEPERRENTSGYYTPGKNTIYVKEKYRAQLKQFSDIATHELIHLTQTGTKNFYIMEGLAEILSNEFYGSELNSYHFTVKNTKLLTEIIGPDAVLNSVFSHDNALFENSIKEYLDEEDSKELFSLLKNEDIYMSSKKIELDQKVYDLLQKMLLAKYGNDKQEIEAVNLSYNSSNKFYFNNKKENYYMTLEHKNNNNEYMQVNSIVNYLKNEDINQDIIIYRIHYSAKDFLNNIDKIKQLYIDKVLTEPIEIIDSNVDDNNLIGTSTNNMSFMIDTDGNLSINDTIISITTIEKIVNNYSDIEFSINYNKPININNIKDIIDNHFIGEVTYKNGKNIIVKDNIVDSQHTEVITLPSISERFDIEYLNKEKSK